MLGLAADWHQRYVLRVSSRCHNVVEHNDPVRLSSDPGRLAVRLAGISIDNGLISNNAGAYLARAGNEGQSVHSIRNLEARNVALE